MNETESPAPDAVSTGGARQRADDADAVASQDRLSNENRATPAARRAPSASGMLWVVTLTLPILIAGLAIAVGVFGLLLRVFAR